MASLSTNNNHTYENYTPKKNIGNRHDKLPAKVDDPRQQHRNDDIRKIWDLPVSVAPPQCNPLDAECIFDAASILEKSGISDWSRGLDTTVQRDGTFRLSALTIEDDHPLCFVAQKMIDHLFLWWWEQLSVGKLAEGRDYVLEGFVITRKSFPELFAALETEFKSAVAKLAAIPKLRQRDDIITPVYANKVLADELITLSYGLVDDVHEAKIWRELSKPCVHLARDFQRFQGGKVVRQVDRKAYLGKWPPLNYKRSTGYEVVNWRPQDVMVLIANQMKDCVNSHLQRIREEARLLKEQLTKEFKEKERFATMEEELAWWAANPLVSWADEVESEMDPDLQHIDNQVQEMEAQLKSYVPDFKIPDIRFIRKLTSWRQTRDLSIKRAKQNEAKKDNKARKEKGNPFLADTPRDIMPKKQRALQILIDEYARVELLAQHNPSLQNKLNRLKIQVRKARLAVEQDEAQQQAGSSSSIGKVSQRTSEGDRLKGRRLKQLRAEDAGFVKSKGKGRAKRSQQDSNSGLWEY